MADEGQCRKRRAMPSWRASLPAADGSALARRSWQGSRAPNNAAGRPGASGQRGDRYTGGSSKPGAACPCWISSTRRSLTVPPGCS